jgi:phospholipid/cholesterol/gamma-HCH transport system permease protein
MEASEYTPPYRRDAAASSRPGLVAQWAHQFADPIRSFLLEGTEIAMFTGRTVVEVRGVWRYTAETLRQTGILITGSALVLLGIEFVFGLTCGNEGIYVLRGYGADSYAGVFTALCPIREMTPYMFAWMVAAKIGCGYVAELGSMRINEEIDALESLGINSIRYLCSTRLLANAMIVFPVFMVGTLVFYLGEMFVILMQIKSISFATWSSVHWNFIDWSSMLGSFTKTLVMWLAVVCAQLYYGYTARGGPVGVGAATARSMIVALGVSMVISEAFTFFFWGVDPRLPVGG